jgi:hypothetical protein
MAASDSSAEVAGEAPPSLPEVPAADEVEPAPATTTEEVAAPPIDLTADEGVEAPTARHPDQTVATAGEDEADDTGRVDPGAGPATADDAVSSTEG